MKIKINLPVEVEIDDEAFEKTISKSLEANPDFVCVLRCKDCKWFNTLGCAMDIVDDSDKPKEDDFCSYGERRK